MPGQPQPYAKVTWYFEDGKYGWSETLWIAAQNTGPKINPFSVLNKAIALGDLRAKMLAGWGTSSQNCNGNTCSSFPNLTYIRVSQVGLPRNNAVWDPQAGVLTTAPGITPVPGTANTSYGWNKDLGLLAAANPYNAMEYIGTLANGQTFKRSLSGVPAAEVCDQTWKKFGLLATAFDAWAARVVADGWGIMSTSIVGNGVNTAGAVKITSITPNGDSYCHPLVNIPSPLSFPAVNPANPLACVNNYVQIFCYKAQKGFPNLNGIYKVSPLYGSTGPNWLELLLYRSPKCFSYVDPGYIMPYVGPVFSLITSLALNKPIHKKRGGPFDRPHGRLSRTR